MKPLVDIKIKLEILKLGSVEPQTQSKKPDPQMNTTLGIIQKNLDFKLNIDMDVESAHLDEIEPDKGKVYYFSYPHFDIHLLRIV